MTAAGTIAILIPGTSFSIRKPFARRRDRIGAFIFALGVMQMGMWMDEAGRFYHT